VAGGALIEARIGVADGPIEIVEYDPSWPASYDAECERLAPLLPGIRIYHIGSTAVSGLAAKAVIDMIALVDDLDSNIAALMQRAGYQLPARFNVGLVHRRFLCYPTTTCRTHHLHLVDEREHMNRCLRFRDSLRANRKLAADYAALKRALAARFREDRDGYTKAKSKFINDADSQDGSPASRFVMSGSRQPRHLQHLPVGHRYREIISIVTRAPSARDIPTAASNSQ
jgi:GrpB-like predicted nucleotidyltransferase (UPF0157 family)